MPCFKVVDEKQALFSLPFTQIAKVKSLAEVGKPNLPNHLAVR
jgi:hypothetical protein